MIGNFSLPAASATGGRQALRHLWTRRTLVCSANTKNSTAGLLIVRWIQLLLVFSWGFQPPHSDKSQPNVLDSDPISVRTKTPSAGISHAVYFRFPAALLEYPTGGSEQSGKCMNFGIVYTK